MQDEQTDLPIFPTSAPAVFCDPDVMQHLFSEVLAALAEVVEIDDDQLGLPTPCAQLSVGELRSHVLGWLQFFAAALLDPTANEPRPDPAEFELTNITPRALVERASADFGRAIAADAAGQLVTMSAARMAGDGVLGMALGEYIIHAWDLATATGRPFSAPDAAVVPSHEFLLGMVAPEYRGPDTGFFDQEVEVAQGSSALDQLLGFAGRDPHWTPAT